jgi:TPR repeat protein
MGTKNIIENVIPYSFLETAAERIIMTSYEDFEDYWLKALIERVKIIENNEERWDAMYELALKLFEGEVVGRNPDLAMQFMRDAANEGSEPAAQFCSYYTDNNLADLECRADAGEVDAQEKLGEVYYDEIGIDRLACYWWRRAVENNNDEDLMWMIYELYLQGGYRLEADKEEATRWLRILIEVHNNPKARYLMARKLIMENVVTRDTIDGWQLLRVLAEAGYADAQIDLALELLVGTPTAVNYAEAERLLDMAAKSSPAAMIHLGRMLEIGFEGIRNPARSLSLYQSSDSYKGRAEIERLYEEVSQKFTGSLEDVMEARRFAEAGALAAQYFVGISLRASNTSENDREKAAYWLKLAASRGHEAASAAYEEFSHMIPPRRLRQICHRVREDLRGGDAPGRGVVFGRSLSR